MNYIKKAQTLLRGFVCLSTALIAKWQIASVMAISQPQMANLLLMQLRQKLFARYLSVTSVAIAIVRLWQHWTNSASPTGKAKWNREAISKLLSNENYTGSVLLQKAICFAGAQFQNCGEQEQVLIRGHHVTIIASRDYDCVQKMKMERSKRHTQGCSMGMSY